MTSTKRIVLNTAASYARSMLSMLCGIFSARWVLAALGEVDFGLFGLIGSLVIFVSFLNIQFSSSVARYYAYSVGASLKSGRCSGDALKECRSWFTIAVLIHVALPVLLVGIGWPVGEYLIEHKYLNIPEQRLMDCVWLWRFVCLSTFVAMVNVPFQAMFTAKQHIVEVTLYSLIQTVSRTVFAYYMCCASGDWLVRYGLMMMTVAIIPQILICIRAIIKFQECRLERSAINDYWRIGKLANFAFWSGVGGIGYIASHQCMSIVLNENFGARVTGSFSVAQTVSGEAGAMTGALQAAFQPAITTAYGAGELNVVRRMAFQMCKYGTILTLLFAIPMMLEIDELLRCWLKTPPPLASEMCVSVLWFIIIEKLSYGQLVAVNAFGKVAGFQLLRGTLRVLVIPIAAIFAWMGYDASVVVWALPISAGGVVAADVYMGSRIAGLSMKEWTMKVLCPVLLVLFLALYLGKMFLHCMDQTFLRMLLTSALEFFFVAMISWQIVLDYSERQYLLNKVRGKIIKWHSGV